MHGGAIAGRGSGGAGLKPRVSCSYSGVLGVSQNTEKEDNEDAEDGDAPFCREFIFLVSGSSLSHI